MSTYKSLVWRQEDGDAGIDLADSQGNEHGRDVRKSSAMTITRGLFYVRGIYLKFRVWDVVAPFLRTNMLETCRLTGREAEGRCKVGVEIEGSFDSCLALVRGMVGRLTSSPCLIWLTAN